MLMKNQVLINEKNQEELFDPKQQGILYEMYEDHLDTFFNRYVPWHWHTLLEFVYVTAGSVEYHLPEGMKVIQKGEALFVNSSVMHMVKPLNGQPGCVMQTVLFDHHFLSGSYNSIIEQKYFLPLIQCSDVPVYLIVPDSSDSIRMVNELISAFHEDQEQANGFEFQVQHHLANLWTLLLKETKPLIALSPHKNNASIERLKAMITYIKENYQEKIGLQDIAAAANISKRECCRCFQKNLFLTPTDYLNRYRINMAAQLLTQTPKSVLTISEECGFSSGSYFSKTFQKNMNCSPKEFQKQNFISK